MGGVAKPREHRVRCLPPLTLSGGDTELRFALDGDERGIKLRISQLTEQMVAGLPDRALDLLEIAALVYAVDSSVSRGGPALQQMGRQWNRQFILEVPVRDIEIWQRTDVAQSLEEMLLFLSGDRFTFEFVPNFHRDAERSRFFRFGTESAWSPDRVLMFSGGLDSFGGALEAIIQQRQRVALVSHFSSTKIAPIQKQLHKAVNDQLGLDMSRHFPVQMQIAGGRVVEGTHRSRSFLFAAIGAIVAEAFGRDRVSFYENGVVSLNLPPVGNVLGTRATRTTHPKTLRLMTHFLDRIFSNGMRVDNPFFWHTKTEVVQTIERLGMADHIRQTRSCADVHNQTRQHVHCGRCSQCIDRRFAILSAGLERHDPEEAYRVDLLTGSRKNAPDREMALSYVRNAQLFEHAAPEALGQHFPDVLTAVDSLGEPPSTALSRITDLLKRHGQSVTSVVRQALSRHPPATFPEESLPRLYGEMETRRLLEAQPSQARASDESLTELLTLVIDHKHRRATIDDIVEITGAATFTLLQELAKESLEAAGQGRDPLDYPAIRANALAKRLGLESDEGVRQRLNRSRTELGKKFLSAGLDPEQGKAILENLPGYGYRLNPLLVVVRMHNVNR